MMKRAAKPLPRTRAEAKQATRAALIAAGLAEFDGGGLDASLDSICERAGLTRGAFYVHFADRDELIVAVVHHVLGGFLTGLTALRSSAGGIAGLMRLYIAAAEARSPAITGGSALRMQHVMEACRRSPAVGNAYREVVISARDRIAEVIAVDQATDRIRRDLPAAALADLMIMTALGFAARHELEIPIDLAHVCRVLLALCESVAPIPGAPSAACGLHTGEP